MIFQPIRNKGDKHRSRNTDSSDIRVLNPRFKNERSNAVRNDDGVVILGGDGEDELISLMPSGQILPVTCVSINRNIALH